MAHEFVRDEENVYLNVPYAEAYIPRELFKEEDSNSAVAVEYGEGFKVIGVFNMRFFDNDTEPRDSRPLRTFSYPNSIITFPDSSTTVQLQLTPDREPERYTVLKYYMGDIIMGSENVQAVNNCTRFMNMIMMGKIPESIPYHKFVEIWQTNFEVNNFNPGVPAVILQMIWAEMCRSRSDITKPFRLEYGTGKASPTNYHSTNMNTVAAASSVFTGISFERQTEKMAAAVNMTRAGTEQRRSPIEEVLTM